jgi:hypothetical protein
LLVVVVRVKRATATVRVVEHRRKDYWTIEIAFGDQGRLAPFGLDTRSVELDDNAFINGETTA